MRKMITIRKKIAGFLLAVIIAFGSFCGVVPGMEIKAQAAGTFKVLLWMPYTQGSNPITITWRDLVKSYFEGIGGVTVISKSDDVLLTADDLAGVNLVYIMPCTNSGSLSILGGSNKPNVELLKNFVQAGGRVVMNGEMYGYSTAFNAALSELAGDIGGQFTITQNNSSQSDHPNYSIVLNTQDKPTLTNGCEYIYPDTFASIQCDNPQNAVWVMTDNATPAKVFVVDQKVGNGYITALADCNWITGGSNGRGGDAAIAAAKKFLGNLLMDSAQSIQTENSPTITAQPQDLTWVYGDSTSRSLSVAATSPNNGTLTYQWHTGTSANFTPDDNNKISNATNASYSIPSPETVAVGTYYYKCVVTNTLGGLSSSVTSDAAKVTVTPAQQQNVFTVSIAPTDTQWVYGDTTGRVISVSVTSSNGGTLSYEWYSGASANFTPDNSNKITGATSESYSIPNPETVAVGTYYYKCVVTNTLNGQPASVTSDASKVTVTPAQQQPEPQPQNVFTVSITPTDMQWYCGDTAARVISASVNSSNGGTLSYQWYSGSTENFTPNEANKIAGANNSSYSIPMPDTVPAGVYYYKCTVTNDSGTQTTTITSQAAKATVIEREQEQSQEGKMETAIEKHENTPDTTVEGLNEDVAWEVATPDEKDQIRNKGAKGKLWLEITNIDNSVNASEKQQIEGQAKLLNEGQVGMYLDFSMYFRLGAGNARKVNELNGKTINVKVEVPMSLAASADKKRTFYLASIHNGIFRVHGSSTTGVIPATITDFSTYAIIYADEKEPVFKTSITIKQTEEKIIVNWNQVDGVGKVEVYLAYCGTKYSKKPSKVTTSRKVTIKKINGKKLNQKRNYKMYLVAYDKKGNKIGKTLSCHFGGKNCKYTNPKSLKLSTNEVTLAVGESVKVKGTIKYEDPKKKKLSIRHAERFRYVSECPEIATVDKWGNIIGVGTGFTDIYVVCQNGLSKKVKVTVK